MGQRGRLLRFASFTALIGYADRDTPVSLSLVVELPFSGRSHPPPSTFKTKKHSAREVFCFNGGEREIRTPGTRNEYN